MKISTKITGGKQLKLLLDKMDQQSKPRDVEVGYTANYAIYVHEMVEANFQSPRAEAKFLEKSLRRNSPKASGLVEQNLKRGADFGQSLYMVGLLVKRESQLVSPIDTGHLKGSAYTRFV